MDVQAEPDQPIAGPSRSGASLEDPPAYSREPAAETEKEVLLRYHPRVHDTGDDVDPEYATMVESLGVRCKVLEEEMAKRGPLPIKDLDGDLHLFAVLFHSELTNLVGPSALTKSIPRRKDHTRPGIVNYVFYKNDQLPTLAFYIGAAMVGELSTSPSPLRNRHFNSRD